MVNLASVLCDAEKKSDEQSVKNKRDASIGTYSYSASDISKFDHGSHVKTVTVLKNIEMPSVTDAFSAFSMLNGPQKKAISKTTVEFWPPDMDKEKFYSLKQDSLELWSGNKNQEVVHINKHKQPLPEKLPDIPTDHKAWTSTDITDYQPLIGPTEGSIIDTVSITNPGPVLFPTLEPTTKGPDRYVVHITRSGHKKRKLKKKVKSTVPFVEVSEPFAPYSNSVIETTTNNQNIAEVTPIYENVDEGDNNSKYQAIRYTDVISNLSNLTELSFGEKTTVNKSNNNDNRSTIAITFGENNLMDNANVSSTANDSGNINSKSGGSNETVEISKASSDSLQSTNEMMPLERLLNQLKRAIDDRDIAKIKNIVQMMEEPKLETEKVTAQSTTEVVKMESSSQESTQWSTVTSTTDYNKVHVAPIVTSTVRSKIYLAPRVRNAQKKAKQLVTTSPPDETQLKDKTDESSTSTLSSSTTENITTVVAFSNNSSSMPVRKGRSHHLTPRGRSRHSTRNINRRFGRMQS